MYELVKYDGLIDKIFNLQFNDEDTVSIIGGILSSPNFVFWDLIVTTTGTHNLSTHKWACNI